MTRSARVTTLAALWLVGGVVGTVAARRPQPTCPPARYAITGAAEIGSTAVTSIDVGPVVALGDVCPRVEPQRLRGTRAGVTKVRGRWRTCASVRGKVRLKARIVDECEHLTGRLRAGKQRRRVEAVRTECGPGLLDTAPPDVPFEGTDESLDGRERPAWFDDAKFGIMIHWGMFAVPAWAETVLDPAEWLSGLGKLLEPPEYGREWFTHIPYTEWYSNTMLIDGSPAQQHHQATYGPGFAYEQFRPEFETAAAAWSGETWADLFGEAGARYVVLVTKHHDGFALWPTSVPHPTRPGWHASRDYVGELTAAVRRRCMRMGLYYSGGLDWSVQPGPITNTLDMLGATPQGADYVGYADGQWRELIDRYRPAVMWNDLGYPADGDVLALMADYYNAVPDGVVNDRFALLPGLVRSDYFTPEFNSAPGISEAKFETVRGMGRGFGYNRNESDADLLSAEGLVRLLVDVVSKNGNLLLNVGPLADGTIPAAQADRLRAVGAWLRTNGEAIFGTRPWLRAEGLTATGQPVRFTQRGDGATVYAALLGSPPAGAIVFEELALAPKAVRLLGADGTLPWSRDGAALRVEIATPPAPAAAYVFALDR